MKVYTFSEVGNQSKKICLRTFKCYFDYIEIKNIFLVELLAKSSTYEMLLDLEISFIGPFTGERALHFCALKNIAFICQSIKRPKGSTLKIECLCCNN
jgi:hypothetical protein